MISSQVSPAGEIVMNRSRLNVSLVVLTLSMVCPNLFAENPLNKAREEVRIRQEVKQSVDEWRQSDRSQARNSRERIADRLREIESLVDKLTKTLARW